MTASHCYIHRDKSRVSTRSYIRSALLQRCQKSIHERHATKLNSVYSPAFLLAAILVDGIAHRHLLGLHCALSCVMSRMPSVEVLHVYARDRTTRANTTARRVSSCGAEPWRGLCLWRPDFKGPQILKKKISKSITVLFRSDKRANYCCYQTHVLA